MKNPTTGLFMIGGGVPKNFTQDIVVAAEILGDDAPMHKYAVQVTWPTCATGPFAAPR